MDLKVTVAIASYNHSKFIFECINSVLKQTYSNLEILICDDNSTDNSIEIIHRFKDTRISVFQNNINQGIVKNYNFLLQKATGFYIMILGDDDFISENYIQEMVDLSIKNKNCKISFGSNVILNEFGVVIKTLESKITKYFRNSKN